MQLRYEKIKAWLSINALQLSWHLHGILNMKCSFVFNIFFYFAIS